VHSGVIAEESLLFIRRWVAAEAEWMDGMEVGRTGWERSSEPSGRFTVYTAFWPIAPPATAIRERWPPVARRRSGLLTAVEPRWRLSANRVAPAVPHLKQNI